MLPEGHHDRLRQCGQYVARGPTSPTIRVDDDCRAHLVGLIRCGLIHGCPACAARIRAERAAEIAAALSAHVDAGGVAIMATFTVGHHAGQPLDDVWTTVSRSWGRLLAGRRRARLRDQGLLGFIRSTEVTNGRNGWHPHLHAALLFERELDFDGWVAVYRELRRGWASSMRAQTGRERAISPHAFDFGTIRSEAGVARYVAKVTGAAELARSDRKAGRAGNRTPFAILADAYATGDADDWQLYREWLDGSRGRRAIEWSRGLRERLIPAVPDRTDEEIVAVAPPAARDVCRIAPALWAALRRHNLTTPRANVVGRLVAAVGAGGIPAGIAAMAEAGIAAVARGSPGPGAVPVLILIAETNSTPRG